MSRRRLAPWLLLAWIPAAHAFPPCPMDPVQLDSVESVVQSVPSRFLGHYTLVGDSNALEDSNALHDPDRNKCRDRLHLPGDLTSSGHLGLRPRYADKGGFGVIFLPDLRQLGSDGRNLRYTLSFDIHDAFPRNGDDWVDLVQLELRWNAAPDSMNRGAPSSLYRLRKRLHVLEVIESRAASWDSRNLPLPDLVVATLPIRHDGGGTRIALRWSQRATPAEPIDGAHGGAGPSSIDGGTGPYRIDSAFEVLEVLEAGDVSHYTTSLPEQRVDTLSMGLLDYNAPDIAGYTGAFVELDQVSLEATLDPPEAITH